MRTSWPKPIAVLLEGRCVACRGLLSSGELVFQLAVGTYLEPNITPTLEDLRGEWHPSHYEEHALRPQQQPYFCCRCERIIEGGCLVVYGVIGEKARYPAIRAERRGYELHLIAHYGCWYKKNRKLNTEERKGLIEELSEGL